MNSQKNMPSKKAGQAPREAENIISGSAQDDQLEKFKHGEKRKEHKSGSGATAPADSKDHADNGSSEHR